MQPQSLDKYSYYCKSYDEYSELVGKMFPQPHVQPRSVFDRIAPVGFVVCSDGIHGCTDKTYTEFCQQKGWGIVKRYKKAIPW